LKNNNVNIILYILWFIINHVFVWVHYSIVHNSQDMETTYVSNGWIDKKGWQSRLSGSVPAWQVWGPEFKPDYHKTKQRIDLKNLVCIYNGVLYSI
jgi:hypothetical protein